ncbi:MAG: hypothetical protein Q8918_03055 [Bacteroidota bacterium]|nr:hypothetical protein [Bacteroidota bacterium]MDP4212180.1 hypothetical protein [Bacteroidota bacterium]MDP4249070.1 hypothetical protein [Bacteroidota bacterium]
MITKEKKSTKVGKYVSTEFVDNVTREYKRERWIHNSERIGKEDSLSAWYGVEDIEGFLANIKQYGADGVKFYFMAYPADFPEKPEYAGRQSLVMVATKSKTTEMGTTVNKDVYITKNGTNTILGFNMANICPPACGLFGGDSVGVTLIDRGNKGIEIV